MKNLLYLINITDKFYLEISPFLFSKKLWATDFQGKKCYFTNAKLVLTCVINSFTLTQFLHIY